MHSEPPHVPGKPFLPLGHQVGCFMQNAPPMASMFSGFVPSATKPPHVPFGNVDIQPSNACPRNFVIFDQTKHRSQIMFHPEISRDMVCPGFGIDTSVFQSNFHQGHEEDERKMPSFFKEDTDDINALLSTEYDEDQECDDELVSTARTNAMHECSSPESYSNYELQPKRRRSVYRKTSASYDDDKRRQRMKKMVKALKRVVPGANRMSTVAVLDEAVRYLKSLRVEVQKLGIGDLKV